VVLVRYSGSTYIQSGDVTVKILTSPPSPRSHRCHCCYYHYRHHCCYRCYCSENSNLNCLYIYLKFNANVLYVLILIINTINISSNKSLSLPPSLLKQQLLALLAMPSSLVQSFRSTPSSAPKATGIFKSNAYIFTARLFKRTTLASNLPFVLYSCTQPNCSYKTTIVTTKVTSTSNLLKHYHACY
jgi:hypothetical protein